jgi:heat shock protein 5
VQRVIKRVPYKLVEKDFNPHIQVKTNDGVAKEFGAEQITATVIAKLREAAEAYIGRDVRYAIFTVPQHYNDAPKESMRYAGWIAGMHATRMLDEPIVAAVAYGLHQKLREEDNALVLHVGGGTADASVLTVADGVFQYCSARHDPFLGGDDFDQRIVDHFVELIKQKHGRDISNDKEAHGKLRTACEQAKKVLSTRRHAQLAIESLVDGVNFSETLTRAKFEELNQDLFLKVMALLDRVMVEAELEKRRSMIDEIVLIGGSTMIPKIQRLVRDYFDGKEINASLKPDEVVTLGAALLTHPSADG